MPYTRRNHVVTPKQRVDYAAMLDGFIRILAWGQEMDEADFREWMKTEMGEKVFAYCCHVCGVPFFKCHYQKKGKE